jgi:hypothetical protein
MELAEYMPEILPHPLAPILGRKLSVSRNDFILKCFATAPLAILCRLPCDLSQNAPLQGFSPRSRLLARRRASVPNRSLS